MIELSESQNDKAEKSNEVVGGDSEIDAESELVFLLSRVKVDEHARSRLDVLLSGELDWSKVVRIADQHGVLPVFFFQSKKLLWSQIPHDSQQLIKQWAWENSLDNLRIADELVTIIQQLKTRGVSCIPFKGPLLSEKLHSDLAMRAAGDLDLLISDEDIDVTIGFLSTRGYKPCKWREKDLPSQFFCAKTLKQYCHEYTFFSEQTGVRVDLHWKVFPDAFCSLTNAELISSLSEWSFGGHRVDSFSDEHTLLILAAHASHHAWCAMYYSADLERFILACPKLDWDKVLDLADRTGSLRMLLLGLFLINAATLETLPDQVRRMVAQDNIIRALGKEIMERTLSKPFAMQWKQLRTWRFYLQLKPSVSEKLHALREMCTEPTIDEYLLSSKLKTPPGFTRMIRPAALLIRHGPRLSRRLLSGKYDRNLNNRDD